MILIIGVAKNSIVGIMLVPFLINGQHNLLITKEHNYNSDATKKDIIMDVFNLK